jgi:hypothetical protein
MNSSNFAVLRRLSKRRRSDARSDLVDFNKIVFFHVAHRNESIVSIEAVSLHSDQVFRVHVQQLDLNHSLEESDSSSDLNMKALPFKSVGLRVALHQFVHYITSLGEPNVILACYNNLFKKKAILVLIKSLDTVGLWQQFAPKLFGVLPINSLVKTLQPTRKHFQFEVVYKALLNEPLDTNQLALAYRTLFQKWIIPNARKKNVLINQYSLELDMFVAP